MNYSNLQNLTNFTQSSPEFKHVHFFLQRVNVPGLTCSPDQLGGRGRNKVYSGVNTIEFNTLTFDMLIDENLEIWLELQNYFRTRVHKDGSFNPVPFQFTLQINNSKGNKLMNIEFSNCQITSLGDIQLDTQQDVTHHNLSVDMVYDHYEITGNSSSKNNNQDYVKFDNTDTIE